MSEKFTVKDDKTGEEVELNVLDPSPRILNEASVFYAKKLNEAIKDGAMLRLKLHEVMVDQGIWGDKQQERWDKIQDQIEERENKLAAGGIKLLEARKLSIELIALRSSLQSLNAERMQLDNATADAIAENAKMLFLVAACTVYVKDSKPYFTDHEDFLNRQNCEAAGPAFNAMAEKVYGLDKDYMKNLPEYKFLQTFKFVNDDLQFIDKEGNRISVEELSVDTSDAVKKDEIEFSPFLDDDGNPIVEQKEKKKPGPKPKKTVEE